MIFGWKKRCLKAEAENLRLREQLRQLESQVAQLQGQNAQLVSALGQKSHAASR